MNSFKALDIPTIPLEGTNLIEASAGTGKTYTIAHLYLRLLLEKQYDVRSILVVTFTEATTKELVERIRSNLSDVYRVCESNSTSEDAIVSRILESRFKHQSKEAIKTILRKAIIRFDEASIYTIHGFCKRILSDFSFETSILFDTELISDQQQLIREIADDFQRITFSKSPAIMSEIAGKAGLDSSGCVRFAHRLLRMPAAKLVPEAPAAIMDQLDKLLSDIKKEWMASGNEIEQILFEDGALKRDQKTYRKDVLAGYIKAINQWVHQKTSTRVLKALSMMATETMQHASKKNKDAPKHRFFDLCQQALNLVPGVAIRLKHTFASYLQQEMDLRKKQTNVHTFDDLISTVYIGLGSEGPNQRLQELVREKYRVALVDEFQDTDSLQYDIFKRIFSEHDGLFLIGDPKQSIYSFRGADLFSYFKAAKSVPAEKNFTLDTNWRSETGVMDAVNALFTKTENPFVLGDEISFFESQASTTSKGNRAKLEIKGDGRHNLVFRHLKNRDPNKINKPLNKEDAARQAIEETVLEISHLLDNAKKGHATIGGENIKPSDIAILVLRNKDAQDIKEVLTQLNIPAVMTKSGNVFHSQEAQDFQRVLEAVSSPLQTTRLNAALATEILGLEGNQILTFLEDDNQRDSYEEHITRFSNYRELWSGKGFMRMFRKMMADYQVRHNLLALPGGERKLTNVLHLAELIHTRSLIDKPGINGLLSWLEEQRLAEDQVEENELRLERDDEAVQILTVFKSKGLQYPIVFCPFMWQRTAITKDDEISYHQEEELLLDLGSDGQSILGRQIAQQEILADLMRLLYVALTRAQNRCYVICGRIGKTSASCLDYLFSGGKQREQLNVDTLMNDISKMAEKDYLEKAQQSLAGKPVTLEVAPDKTPHPVVYTPDNNTGSKTLECRDYPQKNQWSREWGIASYSGITAGDNRSHYAEDDVLLTDEVLDPNMKAMDTDQDTFFGFPSGRLAGTCIHSVFEKLDFTNVNGDDFENTIRQSLIRYGLASMDVDDGQVSPNIVRMKTMITRVLTSPITAGSDTLLLNQIDEQNKLVELEFHFAMSRLTAENLQQYATHSGTLKERLKLLNFKPINGYMHGFIDLVIKAGEKFYILDWKSNNLGNTYADYHPEKLAQTMNSHLYNLQYLIYTAALNQYLEQRLPEYDYNKHFGGVFYLFVRGMHPKLPGNGVFFDLPSEELVLGFSKLVRKT